MARGPEILSIVSVELEKLNSWVKNQVIEAREIKKACTVDVIHKNFLGITRAVIIGENQVRIIVNIVKD